MDGPADSRGALTAAAPSGVLTFLFTDVEGSTRRWEADAEGMRVALAAHDNVLRNAIESRGGFMFKHTGDGACAAFTSPRAAVDAAVAAQQVLELPVRMGIATGEAELRAGDYFGPVLNRAARVMAAGHGGQILLADLTAQLVAGIDLMDLGPHRLRDVPIPVGIFQVCVPGLQSDFPPLRTPRSVGVHNLPVQLTNFIGRNAEIDSIRQLLANNRLVGLTGAGGAGKTRLAIETSARIAPEFGDGVWYVDLAPIVHAEVVPMTVANALGVPDHPGRSTMDTLLRFIADRHLLILLDNCEHLLDASAEMIVALLGSAPGVSVLTTSREPIGVAGEATCRVPSLALTDGAVELFADRARLAQTGFAINDDNAATVAEICSRLDGMPLAIELAAARVRALSLAEILEGLHDRFRLLTGGARTAVRRQQTLRASVDWSHALLSERERISFRRLGVFHGGFELNGATAVVGGKDVEPYDVRDQLSLLADKSLVIAENICDRTRYRLLETVRQYAQERLAESGEADAIRTRHRDHYTALVAQHEVLADRDHEQRINYAEIEIDNLRAAFGWSREKHDVDLALSLASSLQPFWQARARIREGLAWFDAVLGDLDAQHIEVVPQVRARALADRALLAIMVGASDSLAQAQEALVIARGVEDPALMVRALTACGLIAGYSSNGELARPYFAEAIELARAVGDRWRLSQILAYQATTTGIAGDDPMAAQTAAEEGRDLADAIGNRFLSRHCRLFLGAAYLYQGDLDHAAALFDEVVTEADAANDVNRKVGGIAYQGIVLAWRGDADAARASAEAAIAASAETGGIFGAMCYSVLAFAALATGDVAAARRAIEAWPPLDVLPQTASLRKAFNAEIALTDGDLLEARRLADAAVVTSTTGYYLAVGLLTRAHVATAQGQPEQSTSDAYDALACAAKVGAFLGVPDILEFLARLVGDSDNYCEAARLFGAAHAIRARLGMGRLALWDFHYEQSLATLRDVMSVRNFESAWAEGEAMTTDEAISYAQRGRDERQRPVIN